MSAIKKVAIAGATGDLGSVLTQEIVSAGFEVTALTRDASTAKLPAGVKAVSVDYSSLDSLKQALQGQDAVISTLGSLVIELQKNLADAAIQTGIKRFIPSEFGSDHTTDEARAMPVYKSKVDMEEYLKEAVKGTSTSYTIFTNNGFLDWGLEKGFLINIKEKKNTLYDGGDNKFTVAPLSLVGQGVAGVLRNLDQTANREVKMHGYSVTNKSLQDLASEVVGKDGWEVTEVDSVDATKQAYKTLGEQPENFPAWGFPMIFRAAMGKGMITDYADKNDNAVIGIKELTDAEVREIVKTAIAKL